MGSDAKPLTRGEVLLAPCNHKALIQVGVDVALATVEALDAAREEARVLKERVKGLEAFVPTVDAINALPEGVRRFVHDLETRCDTAGDTAALAVLKENVRGLEILFEQANARVKELDAECEALNNAFPEYGKTGRELQEERTRTEEAKARVKVLAKALAIAQKSIVNETCSACRKSFAGLRCADFAGVSDTHVVNCQCDGLDPAIDVLTEEEKTP